MLYTYAKQHWLLPLGLHCRKTDRHTGWDRSPFARLQDKSDALSRVRRGSYSGGTVLGGNAASGMTRFRGFGCSPSLRKELADVWIWFQLSGALYECHRLNELSIHFERQNKSHIRGFTCFVVKNIGRLTSAWNCGPSDHISRRHTHTYSETEMTNVYNLQWGYHILSLSHTYFSNADLWCRHRGCYRSNGRIHALR